MHVALHVSCDSLHNGSHRVSKAMGVLNFDIAFAFEIKLMGSNHHDREVIVVTSDQSAIIWVVNVLCV